ncbi:signal transduction histidine kinase [Anaerobacterium chartisolvens]|uniref:histidine kinase n=1 Tax=Anaerobacterium chartisolvens TaxID=1297424 RepID=A0A369BD08_9FIRM|nr:ATP-binding protein [Anaerobacterium chartisolvens]RCX19439.1 signal transduction histidine kinase [Anaerobacterium chartisolvens]
MTGATARILVYLFSAAVLLLLIIMIETLKNKKQLHRMCSISVGLLFLWTLFRLLNQASAILTEDIMWLFFCMGSISVFFLPSTLILLSVLLINDRIQGIRTYVWTLIPPVVSTLMIITNDLHGVFLIRHPIYAKVISYGTYYYIHCTWQLFFATGAIIYIIRFSLKYTECLSKQILIVVLGMSTPIVVDYLLYLGYFLMMPLELPDYVHTISYCFTAICITYAIYKYRFLDMIPIAVKSIVDNISDSFILIDYRNNILKINKAFKYEFGKYIDENENDFSEIFKNKIFGNINMKISDGVLKAREDAASVKFEYEFGAGGSVKYFDVEITPVFIQKRFMATLILFKNITEHKQVLKLIEENTNQMVEKARLISLNQLIGGIAHNIKSPLMASSGGILAISRHTRSIDKLLEDLNIYSQYPQYISVIKEMNKWGDMIKNYLIYISDIITAVKDQATSFNSGDRNVFTVKKILDRVSILMEFELKKYRCRLNKILELDSEAEIEGDITALTQILNNIIINAIQAYDNGGEIDVLVEKSAGQVVFTVKDYGRGIDKEIKDRIFDEMITTKGKEGTGLGLYIANIALKGQFRGNIRIESEKGKGTAVHVSIPQKAEH